MGNIDRLDCVTNLWLVLRENADAGTSRLDDPLALLLGIAKALVFFRLPAAIENLKEGASQNS